MLRKEQTTVDLVLYIGYLYMRVTSASVTSTASRKRSASDSPLAWTKP